MATVTSRSYIFVTGGSGGIGSALCRLLPTIGITPIIGFYTNAAQADSLAKELKGFAVNIDMSVNNSIEKAIQMIVDNLEESDSLVGVIHAASPPPEILPFQKILPEHLSHQFQVNVIGAQLLLKGLITNFFRKKKSGTVIGILTQAIGSDTRAPATGMGAYIIAKSALSSMLSICSAEYPWLKVRMIEPSFTKTKMLDVFDSRYLEMVQSKGQISTPEEVAQLIIEKIQYE
ncbi:SDR family oxidoreductase [Silvanigrella sp.]|jgi:NAD(P)-dependent dehydrogenase (short-subunit alcohol dehydrogenase family)|uniref:SDR family oxidoreductase n=1 Tax=Silvanigrella sp. TaxID=2024976 RepID=UPI0037CA4B88